MRFARLAQYFKLISFPTGAAQNHGDIKDIEKWEGVIKKNGDAHVFYWIGLAHARCQSMTNFLIHCQTICHLNKLNKYGTMNQITK